MDDKTVPAGDPLRIQTCAFKPGCPFQDACHTSRAADTDARCILTAHLPCSHLEASIDDGLQALDEPVSARWRASCCTRLDGVKMPAVSTHGAWDFKDASAWQKVVRDFLPSLSQGIEEEGCTALSA